MIYKMKNLFNTKKQYQVFLLLSLSTLFCFSLLGFRWYYIDYDFSQLNSIRSMANNRGIPSFLFLVWNLFLAWVPYWISLWLKNLEERKAKRWLLGVVLGSWLVFFPNAPYILTDLMHLRNRQPVPHWYDLMLIASFAWTGLMLGFASLSVVQSILRKRMKPWKTWSLIILAIGLGGFGVFLGRFQRWNTWDILTDPMALIEDLGQIVLNPIQFANQLGLAVVLSVFLFLGYLTIIVIAKTETPSPLTTQTLKHRRTETLKN